MDAKKLFTKSLERATAVMDTLTPEDFSKSSPHTKKDRDLIIQMLYELDCVPDALQGRATKKPGDSTANDLLRDENLQAAWHTAADAARHAVDGVDPAFTVHLSSGDATAE